MDMAAADLTADTSTAAIATATADNPYVIQIEVEGSDDIALDLREVPDDIRVHLLKTAAKSYIHNRVSTAAAKTKKDNENWTSYEAATKNDPLQTIVPMPTTPKAVTDFLGVTNGAIKALKEGNLGRRGGDGTKKAKVLRDPLITQITKAVVAKVYRDNVAKDSSYKYPTAQKAVGNDGLAYLRSLLPEWIAAGGTEADFNKAIDTKYVKPARLMLGLDVPKSLADAGNLL